MGRRPARIVLGIHRKDLAASLANGLRAAGHRVALLPPGYELIRRLYPVLSARENQLRPDLLILEAPRSRALCAMILAGVRELDALPVLAVLPPALDGVRPPSAGRARELQRLGARKVFDASTDPAAICAAAAGVIEANRERTHSGAELHEPPFVAGEEGSPVY